MRPCLCSLDVLMPSWECSESFWHEPSQADSEVTARRRTAREGQRKPRARAHADSEASSPWALGLSVACSQMHPNRGRSGSTYKLPETAKGKEIAEKTWVLAPFLPCVSWPELLVSETQFCFFSALLWHETRVPEPFVDDYKKCKHSSSPQALVIQRDRGRNMVQEQTNSCFLKGFNVPGAHRAQVFMSSLCLAAWWEAVGGRKETL